MHGGSRPGGLTRASHLQDCRISTSHGHLWAPRVEVPKPHTFSDKRDVKELDNFLWHMERYFEAITLTDEATKVRIATLYLTDNAILWWRQGFEKKKKNMCIIDT